MLLAVDIGNTQTSFGIFDQGKLTYHWRMETKGSRTEDEYAAFLFPLLNHAKISSQWEGVALCSVVPQADAAFESFCKNYWNLVPLKVHVGMNLGFTVKVEFPKEMGADRLANAAYAVKHLPLPALVIDIGTATTFDVISAEKNYEGGVILPGVRLAFESLGAKTAKLPIADLEFPASVIGKNTVECIQAGILYGYCDLIDGLVERTVKEIGKPTSVALTGGFGSLFCHRLKTKVSYLPNLTLEGIEILHRTNL